MPHILATPKQNVICIAEKPRLSAAVLKQLSYLQRTPTKEKLDLFQQNIETLLSASIQRVAIAGYQQGCNDVQEPLDVVLGLRLKREKQARAKQAARWIAVTTAVSLDINAGMSKDKALSEGRADIIADNELDLGFFGGIRFGWSLDISAKKIWIVSSEHDQDDLCDDNEDDGPISINDVFTSGDFEPPAHINCECDMGLVVGKGKYVKSS